MYLIFVWYFTPCSRLFQHHEELSWWKEGGEIHDNLQVAEWPFHVWPERKSSLDGLELKARSRLRPWSNQLSWYRHAGKDRKMSTWVWTMHTGKLTFIHFIYTTSIYHSLYFMNVNLWSLCFFVLKSSYSHYTTITADKRLFQQSQGTMKHVTITWIQRRFHEEMGWWKPCDVFCLPYIYCPS